jgi:hypothetical protein
MSRQPFGFPDMSKWEKDHPGDTEWSCQWCGIYNASKPRCSECQTEEKVVAEKSKVL